MKLKPYDRLKLNIFNAYDLLINFTLFATVFQVHFEYSYDEDKEDAIYNVIQVCFYNLMLLLNIVVFGVIFVDFLYVIYIAKIKPAKKLLLKLKDNYLRKKKMKEEIRI